MNKYTIENAKQQFKIYALSFGLILPNEILATGEIIYFNPSGKGKNKTDGRYVFYPDAPYSGWFKDWRAGSSVDESWTFKPHDKYEFTEAEQKKLQERKKIREGSSKEAILRAQELWEKSYPCLSHQYLKDKGVKAYGLKIAGPELLTPVFREGKLVAIQRIYKSFETEEPWVKAFVKGTSCVGGYFLLGKPKGVICICEGYATGATVYEATGHCVAITYGSGNLVSASKNLAKEHGDEFIFCADRDIGGGGEKAALEAIKAVGRGRLVMPVFGVVRGVKDSDFNDMVRLGATMEDVKAIVDKSRYLIQNNKKTIEEIEWLYEPAHLAVGQFHIVAGSPGTGKSTLVNSWMAKLSNGEWGKKVGSFIYSSEDAVRSVLIPKLIAAGGDLNIIEFLDEEEPFDPANDRAKIEIILKENPHIKLIVIDSIADIIKTNDSYKNAEVRKDLRPWVEMGMRLGVAILGIAHTTKAAGNKKGEVNRISNISGSLAFGAYARIVSEIREDPIRQMNFLQLIKCSFPTDGVKDGIYFEIVQTQVPGYPKIKTLLTKWGEKIDRDTIELNCLVDIATETPGKIWEAREIITSCLEKGITDNDEIMNRIYEAGISKRTAKSAKKALDLTSIAIKDQHGKILKWEWSKPIPLTKINHEKEAKEWNSLKTELLKNHPPIVEGVFLKDILKFCVDFYLLSELKDFEYLKEFARKLISEGKLPIK